MIHHISGISIPQGPHAIMLKTGPIAFELHVPESSVFPVESVITVFVYLHWSAENGPSWFGFSREIEKRVFLMVIGCSGIGPKIGLAVLADLGAERFLQAIQTQDHTILSKVSGIGAKKAEHIIFHLKGKVDKLLEDGLLAEVGSDIERWHTVSQALESLHYSRTEITRALAHLRSENSNGTAPFDLLMRRALGFLSKQ